MELTKKKQSNNSSVSIFGKQKEQVKMGISDEGYGFLVDRLTQLYKDPLTASIRETMSNAFDTTVKAGTGAPIEVTLTDDYVLIEDQGEGMDFETLRHVFTQYGNSTKADDLDQTGAFGLGAKAPLAYGPTFEVMSVKDGESIHLEMRVTDNGNTAEVISHEKTDKPNGTAVYIPKTDDPSKNGYWGFASKIETALSSYVDYEHEVKVVVNGEEPTPKSSVATREITIFDNIPITYKVYEEKGELTVESLYNFINSLFNLNIYNDKYKLEFSISGWSYFKQAGANKIVVDLPAGLVNFSSSRDEITVDSRFNKVYDELCKEILKDLVGLLAPIEINKENFYRWRRFASMGSQETINKSTYLKDLSIPIKGTEVELFDFLETKTDLGVAGVVLRINSKFESLRTLLDSYYYTEGTLTSAVSHISDCISSNCLCFDETPIQKIMDFDKAIILEVDTEDEVKIKKAIKKVFNFYKGDVLCIVVKEPKEKTKDKFEKMNILNKKLTFMKMSETENLKRSTNSNQYKTGMIECEFYKGLNFLDKDISFESQDYKGETSELIEKLDDKVILVLSPSPVYSSLIRESSLHLMNNMTEEELNDTYSIVVVKPKKLTTKNVDSILSVSNVIACTNISTLERENFSSDYTFKVYKEHIEEIGGLINCNMAFDLNEGVSPVMNRHLKGSLVDLLVEFLNDYSAFEFKFNETYSPISTILLDSFDLRKFNELTNLKYELFDKPLLPVGDNSLYRLISSYEGEGIQGVFKRYIEKIVPLVEELPFVTKVK